MNDESMQAKSDVRMSAGNAKLALPATEVFYQRAMEQPAEIRNRVQSEIGSRPGDTKTAK